MVARIVNFPSGEAHIVAKPRQQHNRLDTPEDPGDGAAEGGGEGVAEGTEE